MGFRTGPLDMAENNFQRGWKNRQTRNDDAQQGFQGRHNANPCDAISVIIHIELAGQDDTNGGNGANAVGIE